MGKLVFDDTAHDQAVMTIDNLNQRIEEVKPLTRNLSDLKFYLQAEASYNTDLENANYKFLIRIEPRPWKFYEGAGLPYRTRRPRS